MHLRSVLALGALWLPLAASAELYSWTDAQGTLHFAQELSQVPPEHRQEAWRRANRSSVPRIQTYQERKPAARRRARRPGGTIHVPFRKQGTLMRVEAELNGWLETPFLIDTGASGIAIPQHVADRLGLRVGPDTRWIETHTANGVVARPVIRLESVRVGEARVENLQATINPSLRIGLLGGSFFNNFVYRVDSAAGVISLAPNEGIRGGLNEQQWRQRFVTLRDAIARIDAYVPRLAPSQNARRAELAAKREELSQALDELEREADRAGVPHAWRD